MQVIYLYFDLDIMVLGKFMQIPQTTEEKPFTTNYGPSNCFTQTKTFTIYII